MVRGELENEIHLYEIPCFKNNLRSRAVFVLLAPTTSTIFYWYGMSVPVEYQQLVKKVLNINGYENEWTNFEIVDVKEGKDDNFLKLLNEDCDNYVSTPNTLFLLDNDKEIWLWQGLITEETNLEQFNTELQLAKRTTTQYALEKEKARGFAVPIKHVRYYSTKFEPPKKEKKARELSVNVKKFLEKKEAEERKKAKEAQKKKEELLALRAQDKKATRRVNVMLKRTKSANQSVIQDAVDNDNTAVTLAGPMQPDEDDYGYVSQEASAFYNKMMEKYSKMPDEPKFNLAKKRVSTNLSNTKDRVKAALEKEREEAMQPHRRKRKHKEHKEEEGDEDGIKLLKIAEKKQFEPIVIEKKEKEEEKLLTKKQRKEIEKEREYLQRREARREAEAKGLPVPEKSLGNNRIPKVGERPPKPVSAEKGERAPKVMEQKQIRPTTDDRIPKLNSSYPSAKPSLTKPSPSTSSSNREPPHKSSSMSSDRSEKFRLPNKDNIKLSKNSTQSSSSSSTVKPSNNQENIRQSVSSISNAKDGKPRPLLNGKPRDFPPKDLKPKKFPPEDMRLKKPVPNGIPAKKMPPPDMKLKKPTPLDQRPKQFPPRDLKPKQFPPADVRRKPFPPKDMKRPPIGKKRQILDDDSEYDSEMDDFIDDDEPEDDYSRYISEILATINQDTGT
ncbi:hypothetical protein NQ318_000354 [Aromia moschata]|uniref:SPT2 homolog N-terminal domain-containing protein n=1 Tax=Aromia moschata TaxID=1265417 RepID=A0AAV8XX84_9CUCU|nr:hypothetical protein NQ318_000354 [Aromia moschata]